MVKRNTVQKKLVLQAVNDLKCHATAEEVYNYVVKIHPSVSKGTVYRNLNSLAENNLIKRVEVPGEADHFDHIIAKHHHVKCIKCNKIFDVDLSDNPDLEKLVKDDKGIIFVDYDIVFKGICPDCKNKQ